MKQVTVFESATGKQYDLVLNIRDIRTLEHAMGVSLFSFAREVAEKNITGLTLDFTIYALQCALPKDTTEDDAIELIEAHCDAGGLVDDINVALLKTIFATGLFTRGTKSPQSTKEEKE